MSNFGEQPNCSIQFCLKIFKVDFPCQGMAEFMPRYFTLVVGLIFWLLTLKLGCLVIVLFLVLKVMISVALAFRDILLLRNHSQRCFISWFICLLIFFKDLLV